MPLMPNSEDEGEEDEFMVDGPAPFENNGAEPMVDKDEDSDADEEQEDEDNEDEEGEEEGEANEEDDQRAEVPVAKEAESHQTAQKKRKAETLTSYSDGSEDEKEDETLNQPNDFSRAPMSAASLGLKTTPPDVVAEEDAAQLPAREQQANASGAQKGEEVHAGRGKKGATQSNGVFVPAVVDPAIRELTFVLPSKGQMWTRVPMEDCLHAVARDDDAKLIQPFEVEWTDLEATKKDQKDVQTKITDANATHCLRSLLIFDMPVVERQSVQTQTNPTRWRACLSRSRYLLRKHTEKYCKSLKNFKLAQASAQTFCGRLNIPLSKSSTSSATMDCHLILTHTNTRPSTTSFRTRRTSYAKSIPNGRSLTPTGRKREARPASPVLDAEGRRWRQEAAKGARSVSTDHRQTRRREWLAADRKDSARQATLYGSGSGQGGAGADKAQKQANARSRGHRFRPAFVDKNDGVANPTQLYKECAARCSNNRRVRHLWRHQRRNCNHRKAAHASLQGRHGEQPYSSEDDEDEPRSGDKGPIAHPHLMKIQNDIRPYTTGLELLDSSNNSLCRTHVFKLFNDKQKLANASICGNYLYVTVTEDPDDGS